jgi:hypothetical protein
MKKLATSVVLGSANLALLGIVSLRYWAHLMLDLPAGISIIPMAITMIAVPLFGLATVGFAIRDFFRPAVRGQAVIACVLFIPVATAYWPPW